MKKITLYGQKGDAINLTIHYETKIRGKDYCIAVVEDEGEFKGESLVFSVEGGENYNLIDDDELIDEIYKRYDADFDKNPPERDDLPSHLIFGWSKEDVADLPDYFEIKDRDGKLCRFRSIRENRVSRGGMEQFAVGEYNNLRLIFKIFPNGNYELLPSREAMELVDVPMRNVYFQRLGEGDNVGGEDDMFEGNSGGGVVWATDDNEKPWYYKPLAKIYLDGKMYMLIEPSWKVEGLLMEEGAPGVVYELEYDEAGPSGMRVITDWELIKKVWEEYWKIGESAELSAFGDDELFE
ncbi:MAG: hypothetical protein J5736_01590 [Bacilli bacterium]|nr:hypothetical protein [Bacilli bacterium]